MAQPPVPQYVVGDIVVPILVDNKDPRLPHTWKITKIEYDKNTYYLSSMQTYGDKTIENLQNLNAFYKKVGYTKYPF